MSKCEHGLTSKECYVCASPKHGDAQQGEAEPLRLAQHIEDGYYGHCPQAAAELRRLYWDELRVREHRGTLADEITRLHAEVAKLQAENRRLREWHATAWNRGHAVGLNGLNTALRQMEEHRKSDAWGNTQLTEALLLAEEQRDELLAALRNMVEMFKNVPTLEQNSFDEPPEPRTQWDYEAYQMIGAACAAIAKVEGAK